jgi:ELWxxDGT repeat protein
MVSALILTFSAVLPARADDAPPPADIATLSLALDFAAGMGSSNPSYLTPYDGGVYFAGDNQLGDGTELWRLDGGGAIDINPGSGSSFPAFLVVYNDILYFTADGADGAGRELWKIDIFYNLSRVLDLYPGSTGSDPTSLAVFNNALYFGAQSPGDTFRLWKYDPINGAQIVNDFGTNLEIAFPESMVVYNNELYLSAFGAGGEGRELWRYNPADGAHLVADICPGSGNSGAMGLTVYNNALYFGADSCDGSGIELWMYDPLNGVQLAADINLSGDSAPAHLEVYNGALYFSADGGDGTGRELWKYDPVNGADQVADVYPGINNSNPSFLAVFNNELYFNATGSPATGAEIWKYTNTAIAQFRPTKSYEGWVLESGENTSAGGTLNTNATTFNLGDNSQDRQYRSILSFNTTSLPDNAVVVSAMLRVRQQGLTGTDPFTTHGNIKIDIRKGAFSGNNALQTSDFQAATSRAGVGTIINFHDRLNWFTTFLSSTAFPFFNKTGVTQLRLRFTKDDNDDNSADFLKFYSADSANLGDYPLLVIKYYIP